jgi:hypothetical protein
MSSEKFGAIYIIISITITFRMDEVLAGGQA